MYGTFSKSLGYPKTLYNKSRNEFRFCFFNTILKGTTHMTAFYIFTVHLYLIKGLPPLRRDTLQHRDGTVKQMRDKRE